MSSLLAMALLAAQVVATPPLSTGDTANVAAPSRNATPAAPQANDKVTCQYHQELGSLVNRTRECHPQSVWDQMALDARNNLNASTLGGNHGRSGGGG